jgi:Cys-rich radical ribosomally synthesized peptide
MIMVPSKNNLKAIVGKINTKKNVKAMPRCACVACNSCTCACSCRRTPKIMKKF